MAADDMSVRSVAMAVPVSEADAVVIVILVSVRVRGPVGACVLGGSIVAVPGACILHRHLIGIGLHLLGFDLLVVIEDVVVLADLSIICMK